MYEAARKGFHWFLAVLVMAETLAAVSYISAFRQRALKDSEGVFRLFFFFEVDGATAAKLTKYLMTLNIRIVDLVWYSISPMLTMKENWKTNQQMKNAMINKLFVVKFVVYYFPFFYIAFMKFHIEGCEGGQAGCIDELVENLNIFFVTHIVFVIAFIVAPMLITRSSIQREIKAAEATSAAGTRYSYLQAQAKCPAFPGETDDFIELISSMGFVMMFAIAMPLMPFLALLSNLVEIRLLAFRLTKINQRAEPLGQEGIGAWNSIITGISVVSTVINVAVAVFAMRPFVDFDMKHKLLIFIGAEHAMVILQLLVSTLVPQKSLSHVVIEEVNTAIVEKIRGDLSAPVAAAPTLQVELPLELKS
eukprot:gnl/TRDRNA2_/TRDRNA2_154155_c0_seq1.p1 gnl/TRDRNA2_/TRDRNA2_154155_c0~~gnl/TRDRNA2_/TRDRNA2_154155_c0_seq1.p1  ORF type:complete len:363 (-),score=65.60 gnl/TRDRNA2_/TRDRNA2_154155_c0_seq1:84-1172(-)